jgi:hypothetical protein
MSRRKIPDADAPAIRALKESNHPNSTDAAIARMYDCSPACVYQFRKKHGIPSKDNRRAWIKSMRLPEPNIEAAEVIDTYTDDGHLVTVYAPRWAHCVSPSPTSIRPRKRPRPPE